MNNKNIVYICNNNHVWLTAISMTSLLVHNSGIHIYVIGPDIQPQNRFLLKQTPQSHGGCCTVLDIPYYKEQQVLKIRRWPSFTIARLFIAKILPDSINRILYLDSDTIITDSIEELWEFDMHGKPYCGVKDCIGWRYKRNIGLAETDPYVNGGVLLADLKPLRRMEISTDIHNFIQKYFYAMSYYEQDILNSVFQGNIGILPAEYNVMTTVVKMNYKELCRLRRPSNYYSMEEINFARANPRIIHFSSHLLSIRPWYKNSENPYAESFRQYAEMSLLDESIRWGTASRRQESIVAIYRSCPPFVKNVLLYVMGFIHAVWYPELRYQKSKMLLVTHKKKDK